MSQPSAPGPAPGYEPSPGTGDRSPRSGRRFGGVIHAYQKYDPVRFPSPNQPPPDLASAGMNHLMAYGERRRLTDEELAEAIELDPSQIAGLGPSLDAIIAMLEERKRRILETYETSHALRRAEKGFKDAAAAGRDAIRSGQLPAGLSSKAAHRLMQRYDRAVSQEQLFDLERLHYHLDDDTNPFARQLMSVIARLQSKYEVDHLDARYAFTGREKMDVPKALEIKEELEQIDELLEQLNEAKKNAKIGIIDLDKLERFAPTEDVNNLSDLQKQVNEMVQRLAEQQGLERREDGTYNLTPKAYRLFQGRLLEKIFSDLQASRTGRHENNLSGEGAVEIQRTKPYEFGDSVSGMDIPTTLTNAMLRAARENPDRPIATPLSLHPDDIEVHLTRNRPKCATSVVMDMSGSMRYDGQYFHCKRMALALEGLIRKEYPGDFLQFIEMYTVAKPRHVSEVPNLMPKIPTLRDPVVRLRADMSDPKVSELMLPPHFTNIQHALRLSRQFLATQDTPNRQVILITDGLPTAHYEGEQLFLLYPPDPRTEQATMREAALCAKEGIVINIFLVPSWSQDHDDIRFAQRMAEQTRGRVIFTAGSDLDRFVVWDYLNHSRSIVA